MLQNDRDVLLPQHLPGIFGAFPPFVDTLGTVTVRLVKKCRQVRRHALAHHGCVELALVILGPAPSFISRTAAPRSPLPREAARSPPNIPCAPI